MIDFAHKNDIIQISSAIDRSDFEGFETEGIKVDKDSLLTHILTDIIAPDSIVIVGKIDNTVEGIVVIHTHEDYFDKNKKSGKVCLWNVTNEQKGGILGIKLLKYAIKEAKRQGCDMIEASYVPGHSPDYLSDVYERLGMKSTETLYRMET